MSAAHVNQYSNIPVFILALPAKELGLCDRGLVKEGLAADLLVIDLEHFDPKENLADPRHAPQGLDYVLVGGEIAVDHGVHTHVNQGQILQAAQWQKMEGNEV